MSTSYFIECETCQSRLESFQVSQWQIPLLLTIIRFAYDIPVIAALIEASNGDLALAASDHHRLDPRWFKAHHGPNHALVVIDEYGRIDGRCGKHYRCDRCTTSHYCNRDAGHEGDCAGRITGAR